ncbi:Cis, cis-muconate transporter protein [Operophtera brumata]|uniref:Cis, cis-muconate transporter protein n=1 Tax=Operophtera brumata TaxID=104452 RepID=A0A0L7LCT5_OPEBR|nr:Cis, cis-muconate transporter protein [Operophtera brumata]
MGLQRARHRLPSVGRTCLHGSLHRRRSDTGYHRTTKTTFCPMTRIFLPRDPARRTIKLARTFIVFLRRNVLSTGTTKSNDASLESGKKTPQVTIWNVIAQPRVLMLCLAASIRHCGGMTFAYNADLYYRDYFPDVDLGWWLFAVTVGVGSVGVVAGGVISDKSRVLILALSQLIATLPAFGSVIFGPLWAMITLAISYFFG